jgi:hypothetical protein
MLPELARAFQVQPAVYFERAPAAATIPTGCSARSRTMDTLAQMGADHMMTSVIYGDTAYEVVNGFLGEPEP